MKNNVRRLYTVLTTTQHGNTCTHTKNTIETINLSKQFFYPPDCIVLLIADIQFIGVFIQKTLFWWQCQIKIPSHDNKCKTRASFPIHSLRSTMVIINNFKLWLWPTCHILFFRYLTSLCFVRLRLCLVKYFFAQSIYRLFYAFY